MSSPQRPPSAPAQLLTRQPSNKCVLVFNSCLFPRFNGEAVKGSVALHQRETGWQAATVQPMNPVPVCYARASSTTPGLWGRSDSPTSWAWLCKPHSLLWLRWLEWQVGLASTGLDPVCSSSKSHSLFWPYADSDQISRDIAPYRGDLVLLAKSVVPSSYPYAQTSNNRNMSATLKASR